MPEKVSPMQIYTLLPKKNCGRCGVTTCLAFALKVSDGKARFEGCPLLSDTSRQRLLALFAPPVKAVRIGIGAHAVQVGGETVLYRHEDRVVNEAVLAVMLHDCMEGEVLERVVSFVMGFKVERMGQTLTLNMLAVRSLSQDSKAYAECVENVKHLSSKPLILCSRKPALMRAALEVAGSDKPLIYAADRGNGEEMLTLAKCYGCPITLRGESVDDTVNMVKNARDMDVEEIILDVNGDSLSQTVHNLYLARASAIRNSVDELGYPTIGFTRLTVKEMDDVESRAWECLVASTLILRYASIVVLDDLKPWKVLPLLALRQGISTDPRTPVQVKAGLYALGQPNEASPVLLTSNYALTYHTLVGDLGEPLIPCYVLVVDTEGLSVATAIGGGKLTARKVAEALKGSGVEDRVRHRTLVIPGLAFKLRGELEELTGWEAVVGPSKSAQIRGFLKRFPTQKKSKWG